MKIFTTVILLLFMAQSNAQTDCKPYVPTSEGDKWEITNYTHKGKETGKIAYELVSKEETANSTTFTIKAVSYDKKGEITFTNSFDAFCKDGKFEFDMAFMINGEAMSAYESMDVEIDASEFEIPSMDTPEGTQMSDGSLIVKVGSNSMVMFKMTILVTERMVGPKGSLTTAAGTFQCLTFSQKVNTKMIMKVEAYTKEWYAEEIGVVRSESYNKKMKLNGYSELSKIDIQ